MRLGRRAAAGGREVRRQRHRHHAEQQPVRVQQEALAGIPTYRNVEVRLQGWEEFEDKVDRIVSIGAFEAFKVERYAAFFEKAYDILPDDGRMLLHTILAHTQKFFHDNGIKLTISDLKFMRFIEAEIFPGGRCRRWRTSRSWPPTPASRWSAPTCCSRTTRARSTCGPRTWRRAATRRSRSPPQEVYDRYMHYLTGCANFFRRGITNVGQFTLAK